MCNEEIKIYFRNIKGKNKILEVHTFETVSSVKSKIEETEGLPADDQQLYYAGERLENTRRLADYDIQKEAVIILARRLSAGEL